MKNTTSFTFFFIGLAAALIPLIGGVVLDTEGNQVLAGTAYFILPATNGTGAGGGGLRLANYTWDDCPLDVAQGPDELDDGLPVILSPLNSTEGSAVSLSIDSNIKFSAVTTCVGSTVWRIEITLPQGWLVTTGGVEGNPGRETISNWFSIGQFDDAYKIQYCPTVCEICRPYCGHIGIEDGTRRLVRSEEPLKVVFKKA